MKILGIDTASDICSVCLLDNTNVIKELHLNNGKTHSENLVPLLKNLMDTCNITFEDIDLIAVNKGPGSFTGIRIGISTIKAISEIHKIKVVGVTSLQSLTFNDNSIYGSIISLIDARNDQVYCGVFDKNSNTEPIYLADDINQVLNFIKNHVNKETLFIGNGAALHKEKILKFFNKELVFSNNNEQSSISTALAGLDLFNQGDFEDADSILPFYLRKSQAERMKDLKNNGNTI